MDAMLVTEAELLQIIGKKEVDIFALQRVNKSLADELQRRMEEDKRNVEDRESNKG